MPFNQEMLCLHSTFKKGSIAQLVQSMAPKAPGSAVRVVHWNKEIGSIAQLVQSICLTSRGSAVRTRVLPHNNDGACSPVCCFMIIRSVTQSWHIFNFRLVSDRKSKLWICPDLPLSSLPFRYVELLLFGWSYHLMQWKRSQINAYSFSDRSFMENLWGGYKKSDCRRSPAGLLFCTSR